MSEFAPAAAAVITRDSAVLQVFFEKLSKALRQGEAPALNAQQVEDLVSPDISPDLRRCLTLFVDNIGSLPPSVHARLAVALNRDQIPSKLWLIEQLSHAIPLYGIRVLVIGGWYGILPLLFRCLYPSWRIQADLIDLDPAACEVAAILLQGIVQEVKIACKNAREIDYGEFQREGRGVVVNTICEHMSDFDDWFRLLPSGQQIALQSNDHRGCSEHTNCVALLEEFETHALLSDVYFRGTLPLANFRRFMLIGAR